MIFFLLLPFPWNTEKLAKLGPISFWSDNRNLFYVLFWYLKRKLPLEWFVWFEVEISFWKNIFLKKNQVFLVLNMIVIGTYFELKTVWLNLTCMTPYYYVYVSKYSYENTRKTWNLDFIIVCQKIWLVCIHEFKANFSFFGV